MKKRKRPEDRSTKTVGRAWIGRWHANSRENIGRLGWGVPTFIHQGRDAHMLSRDDAHAWWWEGNTKGGWDDQMFLCEVTIKQVFDKNGRPIIKYKSRTNKGSMA